MKGLVAELWALLVALLSHRQFVALSFSVFAVLGSAVAVNYTTHQTRLLYQAQQQQFARLQALQNERSQLGLEVGALASHSRLEAWSKSAGYEYVGEHEVLNGR